MTHSIVFKLVRKDFKINQKPIFLWFIAAVLGILTAYLIPGLIAANIGFSLLVCAVFGLGIHMMAHTVLFDNIKGTHIFIMGLPLTFKQYTISKLLVNTGVFFAMWILLSAACLYTTFSQGILPIGSLPMMSIVLLAILPAYSLILSASMITQSVGGMILTAVPSSFLTSAYLWKIVYLDSVGTYVWGNQAVWNSTVVSIIIAQVLISILIPVLTVIIQFRKKDFI